MELLTQMNSFYNYIHMDQMYCLVKTCLTTLIRLYLIICKVFGRILLKLETRQQKVCKYISCNLDKYLCTLMVHNFSLVENLIFKLLVALNLLAFKNNITAIQLTQESNVF